VVVVGRVVVLGLFLGLAAAFLVVVVVTVVLVVMKLITNN
jgi:hypothetical protein